jgi:hypothetical protein
MRRRRHYAPRRRDQGRCRELASDALSADAVSSLSSARGIRALQLRADLGERLRGAGDGGALQALMDVRSPQTTRRWRWPAACSRGLGVRRQPGREPRTPNSSHARRRNGRRVGRRRRAKITRSLGEESRAGSVMEWRGEPAGNGRVPRRRAGPLAHPASPSSQRGMSDSAVAVSA